MTGRKANGVEPGKQLQMMSPLAGVERALALDNAAGGSDAEPLDSARRRAAAKVRHGGRILSRADLEDYAMTLSPGIAQVRAEKKGGGTRLVVAMAGAEARPSPAQLRAFAAAICEVAGYGLARAGRAERGRAAPAAAGGPAGAAAAHARSVRRGGRAGQGRARRPVRSGHRQS